MYSSLTIIHPRRSNNLLQGIRVKSGGMEPSLDFSSPPPARNKSAVSCSRHVSACATYYTTCARQATFNSYNTSYFPRLDSVDRLPYRKMGKSVRFLLSEFLSGRCAFLPVEGRRLKSSTTSEPLLHAKSLTVNRAIFSWTTILRRSSPPAMEFLSLSFLSPFQCVERREIDGLPFHFPQDGSIFFSSSRRKTIYINTYKFFSCYSLPFCIRLYFNSSSISSGRIKCWIVNSTVKYRNNYRNWTEWGNREQDTRTKLLIK